MKTLKKLLSVLIIILVFTSCEDDNSPIFIVQGDADGIEFLNSFASEYLLSDDTSNNIADRLIWSEPNYGVDTNVNYEVEGSIDPDFNTFELIGSTSETNFAVLIDDLLDFASNLGLDNDPNTTDANGLANNSGIVYLRIKAFLGSNSPTNITYTPSQALTISIIETVDGSSCDSLYALGDAIVGVGWNFPGAELTCENDVLEVKVSLTSGTFRFFQIVGDWNSGLNYTHYNDEGFTIDSDLEDAMDGDNNFRFVGTDGIYTLRIDNQSKEISLTPSASLWAVGGAVPGGWDFNSDTVEFVEMTPNVWSASITLSNDIFRFFQTFGTWDTNNNYAFYDGEGFTIDSNFENEGTGDENFRFIGTPGTYTLTIDANNKEITLN